MSKPNFEDFRYIDNTPDEVITATVENRERVYASTGFDSDQAEQRLPVYLTAPSHIAGDEVIVRMPAWSDDNGRPEGALFDAYLAESTGRRVIAPNAPSIDFSAWADPEYHDASQLTPDQLEELKWRGSFKRTGAAVMRATYNGAKELGIDDPQLVITASSMGSAIAAGAIREALGYGMTLRGITLGETVNTIYRPLPVLGMQFGLQNTTAPGYLAMNPQRLQDAGESMGHWAKRTIEGRRGNLPYARALGRGTFYGDLGFIDGLSRTDQAVPIHISRGGGSRLSPDYAHEELVDHFARVTNVQGVEFAAPHDHPLTMTHRFVSDAAKAVLRDAA